MKKKLLICVGAMFLVSIVNQVFAADNEIKVEGVWGNRYIHTKDKSLEDGGTMVNLTITKKLSDKYKIVTESEVHRPLKDSLPFATSRDGKMHSWAWPFLQANIEGNFDGTIVKLGRFTYTPAYKLVHDNKQQVSGGLVSFGKIVRTTIVVGKNDPFWPGTSSNSTMPGADGLMQRSAYQSIDVVIPASEITNIRAAYQKGTVPLPKEALPTVNPRINFKEFGFDTKVVKNLGLEAALIRSSAAADGHGSYAKLIYKGANPGIAQSFDIYTTYHKLEANSIIGNDIPMLADYKGVRVGTHYVIWKGSLLEVFYDKQKTVKTNAKADMFMAKLDFFF
ncbi:hypothetical protein [Sporomusa acidovorans]|uniref:Phosphate-selective porin O and P n=1 Tax=Sporomusa acidovorans (strain ATCC 49682 / DSM 3132 / Mol) TaxID=1123286 RepID=A0ABZ3J1N9_SPOA4|nr:hypothetical protein [Sporomusa acidovorans]OZC23181.1 hypothetical protein SPACI_08310 [Sporomusa acidovorans DSM 3132]SDE96804.1 hypothetical protein SAMN04488499_102815 [Sporomusa acidovorans]